jgi:hypothetical protein
MKIDWQELSTIISDEPLIIERIRLLNKGVAIEGEIELPPMARLNADDQIFVAAFIRCHGSIKEMEGLFGVSYPTIKSRLNRIGEKLEYVKIESSPSRNEILSRLECGEISPKEAAELLKKTHD